MSGYCTRAIAASAAVVALLFLAGRCPAQSSRRYEHSLGLWREMAADTVTSALFNVRQAPPHLRFVEISREAGTTLPGNTQWFYAVDIDGDQRIDLFEGNNPAPGEAPPNRFYLNLGGGRFAAREGAGLPRYCAGPSSFTDLDGDGRPDVAMLFVPGFEASPPGSGYRFPAGSVDTVASRAATKTVPLTSVLGIFRNEGDVRFREVTTAWLPPLAADERVESFAVADFDRDGRPDLALAVSAGTSRREIRLLRQEGGRFVPRQAWVSPLRLPDIPAESRPRLSWCDWNGDGWPELFLHREVSFWTTDDRLFTAANARGTLGPLLPDLLPATPALTNPAWCDYDRDGDLDCFLGVSDYWGGHNRLLRNDDGHFTDVGRAAGIWAGYDYTREGAWGDLDGDGWPDLFQSRSHSESRPTTGALYLNLRDGTFADVTAVLQPPPGPVAYSAVWFDLDGDGDLDLAVGRGTNYLVATPYSQTGMLLYRNDSVRP
jgi:hypothetical protein